MKEQPASIHFNDKLENLPKPDWQNKEHKHRCTILVKKDCNNTIAWRIDSQEKLLPEMNKDPDEVLIIILDICNIYTLYLNQVTYADKQCNQIQTIALGLEQKLQISNNEKQEAITLLKVQVTKSNRYKKIIDTCQNSLSAK